MRIRTFLAAAAFGLLSLGTAGAAPVTQGAASVPALAQSDTNITAVHWRHRHWRHHHRYHYRHYGWRHRHYRHYGWYRGHHYGWYRRHHHYGWYRRHRYHRHYTWY